MRVSACSYVDEQLRAHCPQFGITIPIGTRRGLDEAEELGLVTARSSMWSAGATAALHSVALDTSRRVSLLVIPIVMGCSALVPLALALIATCYCFIAGQAIGGVTLLVTVVVLLGFNVVHEVGHFAVLRILTASTQHVHLVTRLGFAHLVRPALSGWREVIVVIAGPGTVAASVALIAVGLGGRGGTAITSVAVLAIGFGHLMTLLLPHGDGTNLRAALRRTPNRPKREL